MKIFIIYLVLINIAAIVLMAADKRRAVYHRWRISESVLLAAAVAGGSIGEILAMFLFSHKTKHKSFKIGLPLILLAQIIVFILINNCCNNCCG